MIKLVVFDWNGTILSDNQAVIVATNKVLAMFGLKKVSLKRNQETFDVPVVNFYEANGLKPEVFWQNVDLISETFHSVYEDRADHCRTRAGARKTLKWLEEKGIESVILSNHTTSGIEKQLKRLGIKRFFCKVLANEDKRTALKDKAKLLDGFLREKHFKKSEVLVVGDSPEEMKIAKKLGTKSVALTGGFYSTARLKKAKPDFLINNLGELAKIIQKLDKGGEVL